VKKSTYQLFRPVAFLWTSGQSLDMYRLYAPASVAALTLLIFAFLPFSVDLVGSDSLSDYLSTFFVSLPGFYIAALSAVVAFQGGDLDKEMSDVTAKLLWNGDIADQKVTFRMFLSFLFSYLVVISFAGFFICLVGNILGDSFATLIVSLESSVADSALGAMRAIYAGALVFLASSVVTCTLLGLYFLAERVHQEL
jgi:hypothetical protein